MLLVVTVLGLVIFEGSSDTAQARECELFTSIAEDIAKERGYSAYTINCKTRELKEISSNYRAPAIVLK